MKRLIKLTALSCIPLSWYVLFKPFKKTDVSGIAAYQVHPQNLSKNPNSNFLTKKPSKIGIIGSGITGLAAAKEFSQQGYNVEVLEAKPGPGGVWYNPYDGATIQFAYPHYEFPDLRFPEGTPEIPSGDQIREYIYSYIDKFNLKPLITYNQKVTSVNQDEQQNWTVQIEGQEEKNYDFLIIANGMFSKPNMPSFPDMESFKGPIIHSTQFHDFEEKCKDRKVLIVGGGKSAIDISDISQSYGGNVTHLNRTNLWYMSEFRCLGLSSMKFLYTRIANWFHLPFYDDPWKIWFQTKERWAVSLYWRILGKKQARQVPAPCRSDEGMQKGFWRQQGGAIRQSYYDKLSDGKITLEKGEIARFRENGVQLKNGKSIEADIVILCTGYSQEIFDFPMEDDGIWLYRNTIHPKYKNLAFWGQIHTIFNLAYTDVQAVWLTEVLRGRVRIPGEKEQEKDIERRKKHQRKWYPEGIPHANVQSTQPQLDQWLKDMGINKYRQDSWWKEATKCTMPSDYETVITHRI